MSEEKLAPLLLPPNGRAFLYDEVLLPWEVTKAVQRAEKFDSKKVFAACGFHVVSIGSSEKLLIQESATPFANVEEDGYLFFLNQSGKGYGSGYPCLMKRLRDTVAHGHYTSDIKDWIRIRHVFNSRTHIFGHVEMEKLVALVEFMNTSDEKLASD